MQSQLISRMTQKGQVTIPADIRRMLGLQPGDRVVFRVEDGCVRVEKEQWTLETLYGSIEPLSRPEDWEARIEEAKRDHFLRKYGRRS